MKLKRLESGQGFVEYVIILGLGIAAIILILQLFGISLRDVYCAVVSIFSNSGTCAVSEKPNAVCMDDFSQGTVGWQNRFGNTGVSNGKFCWNSYTQTYNKCSMEQDISDYRIHLEDVVIDEGQGFGVFFRATFGTGGVNGYSFQYDPGLRNSYSPNGYFVIRRWMNGKELWKPIAEAKIPLDFPLYNTPHDIDILVEGPNFTVFVDGVKVLEVTDHVYKEGGVGLRSWSTTTACMSRFEMFEIK